MRVIDLAVWIMANRKGDAFLKWSFEEIVCAINYAKEHNSIAYSFDSKGEFNGVLLAVSRDNTAHIYGVVVTAKGVLKQFAQWMKDRFPNFKITALRNNKLVAYDLNRVVSLLH